jgi:4-diphosphocytidyl-2-C-methyl-D-erythritol kinase
MPQFLAHAKLNLSLSVAPAEGPDAAKPGWHRIASWFVAISLFDTLDIEPLAAGTASRHVVGWAPHAPRTSPIDWPIEKDLAVRAHRLLERETGKPLPIAMALTKSIPVGGGLGGGSSDAAAMLLALNQLFNLELTADRLRSIGASLGSDVPFFIDDEPQADRAANPRPRPALVTGFGETVERLPGIPADIILVIPPFPCTTPAVYAAFDDFTREETEKEARKIRPEGGKPKQPKAANDSLIRSRHEKMLAAGHLKTDLLFNDLFIPTARVEPRVGLLATALSNGTRTTAHLTGSGSCLFLVAEKGKAAATLERARRTIERLTSDSTGPLASHFAGSQIVAIAVAAE